MDGISKRAGRDGGVLRELGRGLADALWPARCPLCGAQGSPAGCGLHALPRAPPGARCRRCAARLAQVLPEGATCARCRRRSPGLSRVVTLGDWRADAGLREWVLASKHGGRADLACELGVALAERLLACTRGGALSPDRAAPLLVPVPLHSIRRWSRGYDQAALLASSLAEHTGLDSRRALVRTRATPPQGAPGSRSRRANVRDAFRVRRGSARVLLARDVWIVDDVATSLATLAACAQALRRAGAAEVGGLVLARAGEA